jgi:TIR domain-containing protein
VLASRRGFFSPHAAMDVPKAFISYSHDSPTHKAWVLKLGSDLRANGVDVVLDQWDLAPGQDVSLFMQKGISEANRVLMICSPSYVAKAEKGVGGVGYERLIVTVEVVASIDTTKFIPILRGTGGAKRVPSFLGPRLYIDFDDDAGYQEKLIELAREIHGAPAVPKPPLGPNPFSGTPSPSTATRILGPTGAPAADDKFLGSDWFLEEKKAAFAKADKLKLTGLMELRIGILHGISKSQIELLNAVRQSEITTFGWPIAILLENRDEFRPRPYGDGIKVEVSIAETGRKSLDYWALRSNGDFYLLQSLFEDQRKAGEIFFDTRIVRVTESFMFAENLYNKLGVPPEVRVGFSVSHYGLDGRTLSSASTNRLVLPKATREGESSSEIVTVLGSMKDSRVNDVRKILEPMFMLFDFSQFRPSVYEEIVGDFERGMVR